MYQQLVDKPRIKKSIDFLCSILPSIIERVVIYITVALTALHLCFILQLLDSYTFVNQECNRAYLMDTQQPVTGGFSKWPSHNPGS